MRGEGLQKGGSGKGRVILDQAQKEFVDLGFKRATLGWLLRWEVVFLGGPRLQPSKMHPAGAECNLRPVRSALSTPNLRPYWLSW